MTMPKGFKSENGYATITELGGKSYQEIADTMTERGFKMNHSTARNVCLRALEKIAIPLCDAFSDELGSDPQVIAKDPRFQESMIAMLRDIY